MREVLFRGKMSDSEKWVFGYYCTFKGSADIFVPFTEEEEKANEGHIFSAVGGLWYSVRSETVGQFTGLTDKNGKKIFAGDIIDWDELEWGCPHRELVEWNYSQFSIRADDWREWCEVIGNIHDNPELLEGFNG